MSVFLTQIQINKIFHLNDILIEIDPFEKKHLILTGKNGSGKSSLLLAIADFLQMIKDDPSFNFLNLDKTKREGDSSQVPGLGAKILNPFFEPRFKLIFDKVNLQFNDIFQVSRKIQDKDFLLAYYSATRKTKVDVLISPTKPNLVPANDLKESKIGEFLKFLVDLKIQEALARNEDQEKEADQIKTWFENFTVLLKDLFEGDEVRLEFNYKDYSFAIHQGERKFGFNELSDGYSAIIDIIADLILKMQDQNLLTRAYEKEGIVLIDEVETHLHLKLQRVVLPMLTKIFPHIQFIITTHSPFVLSSLSNCVAFDLEKQTRLENLTEYSYEALAEGYFKVETDSSYLIEKLNRFKELSGISEKDAAEAEEYKNLDQMFSNMDELLTAPNIKGQYLEIKLSAK